jgi:hypothetical protein
MIDGVSMEDSDIVEDLLRFANASGAVFDQIVEQAMCEARKVDSVLSASSEPQTILADLVRETAPMIQSWARRELKKTLARESFERLDAMRGVSKKSPIDGPITIERILPRNRVDRRVAFSGLEQFGQWAIALIRNPNRRFAKLLCQCRLTECGNYFTAITSGTRPRRNYCTDEHMKLAHKRDAPRRVAKSRAKKRKQI